MKNPLKMFFAKINSINERQKKNIILTELFTDIDLKKSIEVFESVKKEFEHELLKRQNTAYNEVDLINSYFKITPKIDFKKAIDLKVILSDPNFGKPISNLNKDY